MKSAGLDDGIQISVAHYIVVLELPALFKGDMPDSDALGLFTYVSCEHDTHKKAQEEACLTVLTFLLTIAPQQVLIAPNSMGDIDRVRAEAAMFRQTCDPPASGTWFARYTHLHNASQPAQTVSKAIKRGYIEPANEEERAQRDREAIVVLRTWLGNQARQDPSRCPTAIREQLKTLIKPGQLKTFLLRHPCTFIFNAGPGKTWTFSLAAVAAVSRNDVAAFVEAVPVAPTWARLLADDRRLGAIQRARGHEDALDSLPALEPIRPWPPAIDQRGTSAWYTQSQWSSSSTRWWPNDALSWQ